MPTRQIQPNRWLLITERNQSTLFEMARKLPRGSGVLLLVPLGSRDMLRLRYIAQARRLTLRQEKAGDAARVHNLPELRRALLARTELVLLSPIHSTATHPDWSPLPPMRAAALARLGNRQLIALGGMNVRRYAKVAPLGFRAWAGITAFRI